MNIHIHSFLHVLIALEARGGLHAQQVLGRHFPKNEVAGTWSNYQRHWELSLDLNQCRRLREHHAKEAAALADVLLSLLTVLR